MVSARRAPKASTFGLTRPMKLKLSILDYTFEGCPADPASAIHQNSRRRRGVYLEHCELFSGNGFNELSSESPSIVLCTGSCSLSVRTSSSCDGLGLPSIDLRLRSIVRSASIQRSYFDVLNIRVVWLVGASRGGVVRDVVRFRPAAGYFGDGVLRWGLVDGVGDPCVPERLDLGAVIATSGQPASLVSNLFKA